MSNNGRIATWSNVGTDVKGIRTLETVLKKSGLDYNVVKLPLYTGDNKDISVSGRVATVRDTDNKVYGIVSENYEVCQNSDAFDFVNSIKNDIEFVRAGETKSGLVYIIARSESMQILGDTFRPYIIFQNGHNGGYSIKAAISPLRIICQNQFTMAFKESSNTVNIRHTSTMSDKLDEAKTVLQSVSNHMKTMSNEAEKYASIKVTTDQVTKVIDSIFPINADMSTRAVNSAESKRMAFRAAYDHDDNSNFRGTMWGIINASSDYITHYTPDRTSSNWNDNRFVYVTLNPAVMSSFIKTAMSVVG